MEHDLPDSGEISLESVKSRAVKGVVVLTGRTFFLSFISLFATGLLTVFLSPSEFGTFFIVTAIVNFTAFFSDIGLAASLIQKKEEPSKEDYSTTFFVQQALILSAFLVLLIVSPLLTKIYGLDMAGRWLLYSFGASLLMSSLKTIPSVILERKLEFSKLVIPGIAETLVYHVVAVLLAWKGFGVASFTIAILLRGITGLVLIYHYQPWKPSFVFSKVALKKLLHYGLPYQANALLATLKDDGLTAILGGMLGTSALGLLGWAQRWGQAPLRFFMDHVIRVTFPAFSRMQDEKEQLSRSLEKSIFFISFLVFPTSSGLLAVAPLLIDIIPRYEKWYPALVPLALISMNTLLAAITTQLTNVLNATGRIKMTFKLMIMWTVLSYLVIPIMALKYGVNGAALGYLLVGLSSIVVIYLVRRIISFSLKTAVFIPLVVSITMFVVIIIIRNMFSPTFTLFISLVVIGILYYLAGTYLLIGMRLVDDIRLSLKSFFK